MRYFEVRYRTTAHADYLELDCWDGTCRGVVFDGLGSALAALLPGRAEFDCSAIERGLLPRGARLVSRAGLSSDVAFDDAADMAAIEALAAATEYVTPERDAEARVRRPHDARIYDALLSTVRVA